MTGGHDQELSLKALRSLDSCRGYRSSVNYSPPLVREVLLDRVLAHISELLSRHFEIRELAWSDAISGFVDCRSSTTLCV